MNSLRPLLRLAWREVTGQKARTALVVGLVALMVGVAVGAGTITRTTTANNDDFLLSEFGSADVILNLDSQFFPIDVFDESQARADSLVPPPPPIDSEPIPLTDEQITRVIAAAEEILGSEGVIAQSAWLQTSGSTGGPFATSTSQGINVAGLDLNETVFDERYVLLNGRLAQDDREVALTPRALSNHEREVGDSFAIGSEEFTIVGEVARAGSSYSGVAIVTPTAFEGLEFAPGTTFTEVLFSDTDPVMRDTASRIAEAADVPIAFNLTSRANGEFFNGFNDGVVDAGRPEQLSTLIAALFAIQVALVAAAAFAVGVARRTRQFGQLQATGANNTQLQQVVLIQAGLTGLLGAAVGAALGIGVAVLAWTQGWLDVVGDRFPIDFRWNLIDVVGPLIVGVGAAVIAAWWPTRRLKSLAPASALADHIPVSRPTPKAPLFGLVALAGGTLLLLAVTASDLVFDGGDLGAALLILAVLAMFGGALSSIGLLLHRVGERADRFGLLARIVTRNSARHQARSWVAVGALVAVVILPVVLGAATKAYPDSFASDSDNDGWIELQVRSDDELQGQSAFFDELDRRVGDELSPVQHFPVISQQFPFDNDVIPELFFLEPADPFSFRGNTTPTPVRGTERVLAAAGLDTDLWSTPDAPDTVILPATNSAAIDFDGTLVRAGEPVDFVVAEPVPFIQYDSWILVSPEIEERFDLNMVPQEFFLDVGDSSTFADEEALATIANDVWNQTITEGSSSNLSAWINSDRRLGGPTAAQTVWIAIGGFTALAILISLVTSSLAAVEVDKEISTMIAAGAPPTMRRRLLGAQTTYHLFVAAVIGIPLALLMYWAATRADEFGPDGPTFPWTSMAVMGLVVPVIVGLAVAAIFRNGRPAVSRRA